MSKPLDRLTLLETFVRIAERGSISAAARDLGLSQPSASRQLSELEDRLGAQLIRRTTHTLSLTPAGEALLTDARAMLDEWDALTERHGGSATTLRGTIKVVAPVALGQLQLADIMLAFQLTHPNVGIVWELDDRPIRFAEMGCDCWIKVGPVPDESLVVRPVATVERLVVAAPGLARDAPVSTPVDLAQAPFVALAPFEGGKIRLHQTADADRATVAEPDVRMTTNNIFAVRRAALMGAGYAVLPRWFVAADLADGTLVDALPSWRAATLTISVTYLPLRHQPLRQRAFLDHILAEIPKIEGLKTV